MSADEYEGLADRFCPKPDWASDLALTARSAGFRYVTLTCRHHDGFSLYDTRGLSTFDAPHACGRDLVAEFVDACREQGLVPFFYHTLEDWHEPSCPDDWPAYLDYLQESLRLLCTNYGRVGGFWFDGIWAHPDKDWHEDELYGLVRQLQPDAILVNNTGLNARGQLGNIELDSVTFERGIPQAINLADSPKYVASEMSETFGDHWGYAAEDIDYKSPADVIREIVTCRRHGSNMPLIGWALGTQFLWLIAPVDHWIAFVLLAFIGGKMLWEAVHEDDEGDCKPADTIDLGEFTILAIATSIDALAVGISFAALSVEIVSSSMDRPASRARARLGRRSSRSREVVILALLQPRLRPARLLLRGVVPRERPLHPLERRRLRAVLPLLRLRGGVAPRHRLVARRRACVRSRGASQRRWC